MEGTPPDSARGNPRDMIRRGNPSALPFDYSKPVIQDNVHEDSFKCEENMKFPTSLKDLRPRPERKEDAKPQTQM